MRLMDRHKGGISNMKRRRILFGIFLIVCCAAVFPRPGLAQEREVPQFVVVGHTSVPETLAENEVKQIFLGRMTAKAGNPIGFVIFKEDAAYAAFLRAYVSKTITQYTNYWKKQVFTGKGRMPKMFENAADMLEYVASHDGVISFILPDEIIDHDTVHIITVVE
jgi:hypothetical protein